MKTKFALATLSLIIAFCSHTVTAGGNPEACSTPTVITKQVPTSCPPAEVVTAILGREQYVIGQVSKGFSSTSGGDAVSLHYESSNDGKQFDLTSDESGYGAIYGVEFFAFFDFTEFGFSTHSGSYGENLETRRLGVTSSTESLEVFVQGKKTMLTVGRFGVHGLAGIGLKSSVTNITRTDSKSNPELLDTSSTDVTPTLRAGLGLSFDLSDNVALVARGTYSLEMTDRDNVHTLDACWEDISVLQDDNGLEASVGVRFNF